MEVVDAWWFLCMAGCISLNSMRQSNGTMIKKRITLEYVMLPNSIQRLYRQFEELGWHKLISNRYSFQAIGHRQCQIGPGNLPPSSFTANLLVRTFPSKTDIDIYIIWDLLLLPFSANLVISELLFTYYKVLIPIELWTWDGIPLFPSSTLLLKSFPSATIVA